MKKWTHEWSHQWGLGLKCGTGQYFCAGLWRGTELHLVGIGLWYATELWYDILVNIGMWCGTDYWCGTGNWHLPISTACKHINFV